MNVREHRVGDVERLEALMASAREARQRARFRIALLALRGWEASRIAEALSSNRRTVQAWVFRYRDRRIDGLMPIKSKGHAPRLPPERNAEFLARLAAGPREGDGVCTLRARDARRILEQEFGVSHTLKGVYDLMHRLGLSCLKPRPRHEKSDPAAMEIQGGVGPPLVGTVKEALGPLIHAAGRGRVRVMWMDEARIGQQGTLTPMWAPTGSRPTAVKQTRYDWAYAYAAVEPATGFSSAIIAPHVNTGTMNAFLEVLAGEVDPGDFVVLLMDQAGWHKARTLVVPDNIVILFLPPYSPELNLVENLWAYMRSHFLSNRAYEDYDHIVREVGTAYRSLTPDVLRSVCRCSYAERGS